MPKLTQDRIRAIHEAAVACGFAGDDQHAGLLVGRCAPCVGRRGLGFGEGTVGCSRTAFDAADGKRR